jgi:hypothetical protein
MTTTKMKTAETREKRWLVDRGGKEGWIEEGRKKEGAMYRS